MPASPPSAVFMGSKPGAVAALTMLLERGWEVPFVVVPDEAEPEWAGRPTLAALAQDRGLPVGRQTDIPARLRVSVVVSYMYRHRVTASTLALGSLGAFNFHAAPLPEYGGWRFYSVAILEDADVYGCTCHWMDEGFDTGPLLEVRRFPIEARRHTAVTLEREAQLEMIRLFAAFAGRVERGEALPCVPQDPRAMRYMDALEFRALKRIPSDADAETIDRMARAFWYPPYEGAYLELGDGRVEVVPEAAKLDTARALHQDDLEQLLAAGRTQS